MAIRFEPKKPEDEKAAKPKKAAPRPAEPEPAAAEEERLPFGKPAKAVKPKGKR